MQRHKLPLSLIKVFKNEDNTYTKDNVIGDRKYRRGNNKWTIQRHWQQDDEKQNESKIRYAWTPQCANKHN